MPAHAVPVVHAVEDDRQSAAQRLIPEGAVLVHTGEADAFPHRAAGKRRIADVADYNAGFTVDSLEERGARRNGTGTANNRVIRIDAEGREEGVHRAAHAPVQSGVPREHFRVGPVDQKPPRQFPHRSGVVLLHHA